MRMMTVFVQGTFAGANITPLGFDRLGIKSITKTSPGIYVITVKTAFRRNVMAFVQAAGALAVAPVITSATTTAITVRNMTAAADFDFNLLIIGSEFAYDVAA